MTNENRDPFSVFRQNPAGISSDIQRNSNSSTSNSTALNVSQVKISRKWTVRDLNRLIKNATEGLNDPKRNCAMCCLNALASNLKSLYSEYAPNSIPTNNTMIQATETLVKKGYAKRLKDVLPTLINSEIRFTTGSSIASDNVLTSISSNIADFLSANTPNDSLMFFSVGIGHGYHSTIIGVSKISTLTVSGGNTTYKGNNSKPLFLFIEDLGGARKFYAEDLDKKCNEFIVGATRHYRAFGSADSNLNAIVYLLNPPK